MDLAALRSNDVVQLITEPLAPFMVGAAQVVIDAELADDGSGEIEQAERCVEYEGSDERIGRTFADVKRAGPRDVVGAELGFPCCRDDVLGDIDPVIGISAMAIHEHVRWSETIRLRDLPGPDGQCVPGCPDEEMARLNVDGMTQQDTLELCRVRESGGNVWWWRKRLLISLLRHV